MFYFRLKNRFNQAGKIGLKEARDHVRFVIANPRFMSTTSLETRKGGVAISLLLRALYDKERSPRCARDDRPFVIANPRGVTTSNLSIRKGGVAISLLSLVFSKKRDRHAK